MHCTQCNQEIKDWESDTGLCKQCQGEFEIEADDEWLENEEEVEGRIQCLNNGYEW